MSSSTDRAAEIVEQVAQRHLDCEATAARWQSQMCFSGPDHLWAGYPGLAMLYAELAHREPGYRSAAHVWLTKAARNRSADTASTGLHGGSPALSFALDSAAQQPADYAAALARLGDQVDAQAYRRAHQEAQRTATATRCVTINDYDVISGLTGLGALLMTQHRHALRAVLTALINLTRPIKVDGMQLVGWWVAQDTSRHTAVAPAMGHAGLGMAHGVAGPLALLSLSYLNGCQVPGHEEAIATLATWLLNEQRSDARGTWWPAMLTRDRPHRPPQPSWCYGTTGIARALYLAGAALQIPGWRTRAVAALRSTLSNLHQTPPLTAPGLCHGWSGLLHATWRMAIDSGDDELTTRLPWLAERVMDLADDAQPSGFRYPPHSRDDSTGLLTGAAGVALALHAYATQSAPETAWDRALLLA